MWWGTPTQQEKRLASARLGDEENKDLENKDIYRYTFKFLFIVVTLLGCVPPPRISPASFGRRAGGSWSTNSRKEAACVREVGGWEKMETMIFIAINSNFFSLLLFYRGGVPPPLDPPRLFSDGGRAVHVAQTQQKKRLASARLGGQKKYIWKQWYSSL